MIMHKNRLWSTWKSISVFVGSFSRISSDIILICPHRHSRLLTCERNDVSILRSWANRKSFLPERPMCRRIAVRRFHPALARLVSSDYAVRTLSAPYFRSARFILRSWRMCPVAALRAFREQVEVRDKFPLNIVAETAERSSLTVVDGSCIAFRVILTLSSQSDQADGTALKGY